MKSSNFLKIVAVAGLLAGCMAAIPPKELVNARSAYQHASAGIAVRLAPAELHVAAVALAAAEHAFQDDPDSYRTRDLAYVAQRKSQLAEATASIAWEQGRQAQAGVEYQATQGAIVEQRTQELDETRTALEASERAGDETAEQLAAEQAARVAAERRAAVALAALAELAVVREEPRGTIITLSGSLLFASNQATLLPDARARLDQVAEVLLTTRERDITVEGHTDSQGSDADNIALSQRRADAVRDYLVQQGYGADLIQAHGLGEGTPIADNGDAEGRANNRRVEIIIPREPSASNP